MQAFEAVENLFKKICGLFFCESLFVIQVFLNITFIAVFHDNEDMLVRHEGVNVLDNIIIFTGLEDIDLGLNKLFKFRFFLHLFERDGFDGYSLFISGIVTLVYDRAGAITKFLDDRVGFEFFAD